MLKLYKLAMKCCRRLITLSVSFFLLLTLTSFSCDIVLKSNTAVADNKIFLKDITSKCPNNLKDIYIANTPYINSRLIISNRYLASILKNKGINIGICGKKALITRKAFYITKRLVKNAAKLNNIKIISSMPIALPYAAYTIKLNSIKRNGQFLWIILSIYKSGKLFRNIGISAKRLDKIVIPVASADIRAGQVIDRGKITYKGVFGGINKPILKTISSIEGCVAVVDIRKNQFFTPYNTKRNRLVKRGDMVHVIVIEHSVSISTTAKALRGGFKMDIIPIMYLTSKRIVTAKIIGSKKVLVQ